MQYLHKQNIMIAFNITRKTSANLMLIAISVSPAFALGAGNKNFLLITIMALSMILLLRFPILSLRSDAFGIIGFLMIIFPIIFHPDTLRWSTLLYSCLFIGYFMSYTRLLCNSNYTATDYKHLLKWLIYAYCITLIIQQFCVLFNLPIFNVSNYSTYDRWKLNSLMSEPSHSARVISIIMAIFISIQLKTNRNIVSIKDSFKQNRYVWLAFLWSILTMGSTTGLIFVSVVLNKFISLKQVFATISVVLIIILGGSMMSRSKTFNRFKKIIPAVLTLNEKAIIAADHSGAFRIVPSILGIKKAEANTINGWFGNGVDYDIKAIRMRKLGPMGLSGGIFSLWLNYGLLVQLLYWILTLRVIYQKEFPIVSIYIWILTCVLGGINMQVTWMTLFLMLTYNYTTRKSLNIQ